MATSFEKNNVSTVLDDLSQALNEEKERLNGKVAQAMKDGEYDTATAVIQFTKSLLGFQEEVESLIEKWEKLQSIRDLITPQVRPAAHTRNLQIKPPTRLPRKGKTGNEGITDSTDHCFHILDVLEKMGGVVNNQDVSEAVNKRIKMLYPKFKQARVLMSQRGWTKKNGPSHTLEISQQGIKWLNKQKAQLIGDIQNGRANINKNQEDLVTSQPKNNSSIRLQSSALSHGSDSAPTAETAIHVLKDIPDVRAFLT